MTRLNVFRVGVMASIALVIVAVWVAPLIERERTWHFVRQVLLTSDDGLRTQVIMRWKKSPTISSVFSNPETMAIFNSVVEEVNDALSKTNISLIPVERRENILVLICDHACGKRWSEVPICFYYVKSNGYGCTSSNDDYALIDSLVWVLKDLPNDQRRATLLEEVVQVLGLYADSAIYPDSLFFEFFGYSSSGKTLSQLDRKLIYFLYTYLEPGDREEDVRQAFDKHWYSINIQ